MNILDSLKNIHSSIANDVYPEGWSGNCGKCGKPFQYTKAECAYYLAHGWPRCDHIWNNDEPDPLPEPPPPSRFEGKA